ncbi:MAG: DASS family sodium-coupled anion symporter [Saprospiraceae bacterium]|nr:DASS family sodium-coupled anion symporter [Saprospiraceae bacterium]
MSERKQTIAFKLGFCILVALVLWPMAGWFAMDIRGWHIFSVFIAVIVSFIVRPYPMGMTVLIGLMVLVTSGTISIKESLSGFGDATVWLVIAAFLLAAAVINTGFGLRVALLLLVRLGKSMQGLAYAICGSEFLLGSVIPSNTARGGGLHAPIVDSLARSMEEGTDKPALAGRYLSLVGSHANLIVASMFMTGMAANPLVSKAAREVFDLDFGWGTWLLGSIIPGLLSLLILPKVLYYFAPPTFSDSTAARTLAKKRLNDCGPMQWREKVMLVVLVSMLILWSTQFLHGLSTTLIAWLGVIVLLLSNTQTWQDIISNDLAWDTLIWLGGLLTMANMLAEYGFISWFVDTVKNLTSNASGLGVIISLGLFYFYSMYAFSMLTAHIAAMVIPFLSVCAATNAPPMIAVAVFAYFSCLCGCTTNYSSGPVIIYFGLGYEKAGRWFKIGFVISLIHIVVWLGSGLLWWKILGWW